MFLKKCFQQFSHAEKHEKNIDRKQCFRNNVSWFAQGLKLTLKVRSNWYFYQRKPTREQTNLKYKITIFVPRL